MFPPSSTETKIALLEERINVYEQMMQRIDTAIQKIGETSQNISQMLAIHNEKIEQCNRTDNIIVNMIEDIKRSSKEQHDEISRKLGERIDNIEEKVEEVAKIKWMTIGCGAVLVVLATAISTLASGWWTPSGIQDSRTIQHQGQLK
jgi:tetrahydromethanopterin S-methyltransferase subunit G